MSLKGTPDFSEPPKKLKKAISEAREGKKGADKRLKKFLDTGLLSPEQYEELLKEYSQERFARRWEGEGFEEETIEGISVIFALTPFAFAYGLMHFPIGWRMFFESLAALVVYTVIFCIFQSAIPYFLSKRDDKCESVLKIIVAIAVSFFVTYTVLSQCKII